MVSVVSGEVEEDFLGGRKPECLQNRSGCVCPGAAAIVPREYVMEEGNYLRSVVLVLA